MAHLKGTWKDVPAEQARPGDMATHKRGNLDPRPVVAVGVYSTRDSIWLDLLGQESGPFPRANYTYRRYVPSAKEKADRKREWRERVLALPWVRREPKDVRCDALHWSKMSLKDVVALRAGEEPRDAVRCKHRAEFRLTSTARPRRYETDATKGSYCATHLGMQLSDFEPERRRYQRWLEKQRPEGAL